MEEKSTPPPKKKKTKKEWLGKCYSRKFGGYISMGKEWFGKWRICQILLIYQVNWGLTNNHFIYDMEVLGHFRNCYFELVMIAEKKLLYFSIVYNYGRIVGPLKSAKRNFKAVSLVCEQVDWRNVVIRLLVSWSW